jgi:hypothetical protein
VANEIEFGYTTGKTLKYGAYQKGGATRTAAGTALTEQAGTGYYYASDAAVVAGDSVIVTEGAAIVGAGEYLPAVTASGLTTGLAALEAKINIIDTNVDTVNTNVSTILTTEQRVNTTEIDPLTITEVVVLKGV